ncbi:MAG: hypothetical protein OES46_20140 [Gammaproteobacteria bacterium]|nr:hypothetical protein [Gammaproteobacteria bacterium]
MIHAESKHRNGALPLRPPDVVMRLRRMGSFHQTRISFMRSLLRRIANEGWVLTRPLFELDQEGYGTVVYRVETPAGVCTLVAFSHELQPDERTDRVIAKKWDATFALTLGEPTAADIERLHANVPKQEAGRVSANECVLSRANKSVRLFEHIVNCLAHGWQPSLEDVVDVGYLMRTTAVYGNGKFGLADLPRTFGSGLFTRPFEAEMLTVYLIREFTIDLVEHIAAARAPLRATRLDPPHARALGIGNSTGLGMAPFLVAHPTLLHRWMISRETALARVLNQAEAAPDKRHLFVRLLQRAIGHVAEWHTQDARQASRVEQLHRELVELGEGLPNADAEWLTRVYPWQRLADWAAAHGSEELQELLNSLILEPYGELVDGLADAMTDPETPGFDPAMTLGELRALIERHYSWALSIDFDQADAQHFFWYRSEEKEEPRLGERSKEPGAEWEMRLGIAREVQALYDALTSTTLDANGCVAAFLMHWPDWRYAVRRVQTIDGHHYGEIRDNLLGADCLAIDLLRCKLSFFGAIKFDPKSDRWTRITMYQGAPRFVELDGETADAWALPVFIGKQPELHA